jgi:hypothetical protein
VQACDGHAPTYGDQMATWRRTAGGGEALEHGGGAHFRTELTGAHRLGLQRTRSMGHFKTEKRLEIGAMGGVTTVGNGPGVESSRNTCDMEETKTTTMEGNKSDGKNMKKKNKGEREEERKP